jgi:hypothetical protein
MIKLIHFFIATFLMFAIIENNYSQCNNLEIPDNGIDEDCDGLDGIYLNLPKFIYSVEGQEVELYFRNLILSKHPEDYTFNVLCGINGTHLGDRYKIEANNNSAGEYQLIVQVKINTGQVIAEATSTVRISPNEAPQDMTPRRLILMGHSFFDQGYTPKYIYDLTHQTGNPPITFHGKNSSWANGYARHDGYGGTMARWFVNNEYSPIRYNNKINIKKYYSDVLCPSCTPDWLVIHLDINDFCGYSPLIGTTLAEIEDTITNDWNNNFNRIIDSIHVASPNTKIGICMSPPPNTRQSAFDICHGNNPTLNNKWRWQKIINRLAKKQIQRYGNRESDNIFLIPTNVDIDDFLEYNPEDVRHPDPFDGNPNTHCGYNEISKMIYSWIRWVEHHPNYTPPTTPITYFRDADGDGYGWANNTQQAISAPTGFVSIAGDCDDNNANRNPSLEEICFNDIDDNCNNIVDEDTAKPIALCKTSINILLDNAGTASLVPAQIDNGSYDNCNSLTALVSKNYFTCDDIGLQNVTLTQVDVLGNASNCQTSVNVQDAGVIALCNPSIELPLGGNGNINLQITDINNGSFGGCSAFYMSLSKTQFDCEDLGTNTITLKITNVTGIEKTCQTQVNIVDKSAPLVFCQPSLPLNLDANGNAQILPWQVNAGSWDACGEVTSAIDQSIFSCNQSANTYVTLTVTDESGNTSTCQTQLFVGGSIAPSMQLMVTSLDLTLDATGSAIIPIDSIATANDDCGALDWQYSFNNQTFITSNELFLSCEEVGSMTIWLRVRDISGNFSLSKAIQIQLQDLTSPLLVCQDVNITLHDDEEVVISKDEIVVSATDNCGQITWMPFSDLLFNCIDINSSKTVNLEAHDAKNNMATCSSIIRVLNSLDSDNDGVDDCTDECPTNALTSVSLAFYKDEDDDGFGSGIAIYGCSTPIGTVRNNADCDDNNEDIYPNTLEVFNGIDDDCDGATDEGFVSISEIAAIKSKVILYPNPTNDAITLDWQKADNLAVILISIIEPMGRTLNTTLKSEFLNTKTTFDVSSLAVGTYILKVLFEDGSQEIKRFQKI